MFRWVLPALVRALEVDLNGPYAPDEQLDRAPSRFYLTGFLVLREGRGEEVVVEPEDFASTWPS